MKKKMSPSLSTLAMAVVGLTAVPCFAGVGIDCDNGFRVDRSVVDQATRGGLLADRDDETNDRRLICTDVSATDVEACRTFRFTDLSIVPNAGSMVEVNCHDARQFTAEELSSWSSFKKALRADVPAFRRDLKTFVRDVEMSEEVAIFPAVSPIDNNPSKALLVLLPVTVPIGIASLPVSVVGGAVDSLLTTIKIDHYLKSIVNNDHSVIERFNTAHIDRFDEGLNSGSR